MAVLKKTPLKLNLDKNERFHAKEDMYDALNIRTVSSEGSDGFVAENILGNTKVNYSLPAGDNKVIGAIPHQEKNDLYYFIWNSLNNHTIAVYNDITGSVSTVVQGVVLKFHKNSFIDGFATTKIEDRETILYFTDNINPPRKINVFKAQEFLKGNTVDGYSIINDEVLDLIKYPPLSPPSGVVVQDTSVGTNNLAYGMFQFRYRYYYDDGEVSAYSPSSDTFISQDILSNNVFLNNGISDYNAIDVRIKNGSEICEKIEVIYRNGDNGEWYIFDIFDNNKSYPNTYRVERFYNAGNNGIADPNDTNKLYDAVPLKAATQEYLGRRNFLGNTLDGYNNLDEGVLRDGLSIKPRLLQQESLEQTSIPINLSERYTKEEISIEFDYITYEVDFSSISLSVGNFVYVGFAGYSTDYLIKQGDTVSDVVDSFYDYYVSIKNNKKFKPVIYSVTKTSDKLYIKYKWLTVLSDKFINDLGKSAYYVNDFIPSRSFKSGATHDFGIVFYDRANRSTSVQKKDDSGVYVPFYNERTGLASNNGLYGKVAMDWSLDIVPPREFTHYQFVYTGNTTTDKVLQFVCSSAFKTGTPGNKNSSDDDFIYVGMRHFAGKSKSYTEGSVLEYQYSQGDRVRIISYWDTEQNKRVFADQKIEFEVVGYEFFENDSYNPILSSDTDNTTGWFLILRENDVPGWNRDYIDTGNSSKKELWCPDALHSAYFEIYNPNRQSTNNIFYEFSEMYEIGDAGLPTRHLKGGLRNQGDDVSLSITKYPLIGGTWVDVGLRPPIVIGDVVKITGSLIPSASYNVVNVVENSDGSWRIYLDNRVTYSSAPTTIDLISKGAAGSFTHGDVWWKPREMYDGNNTIDKSRTVILFSEDFNASDFFKSSNWGKGRVNAFSEYSKQLNRKSTIFYSDAYYPDANFNGLSSFNLAQTPYYDYETSYGGITLIKKKGDNLIFYFEDKVGAAGINKNILTSGAGSELVSLTINVLSDINYYAGDYGIGKQPQSWANSNGVHYFVSLKKGAALRLSTDGLTPISNYDVKDFFRDKAKDYTTLYDKVVINAGMDIENSEYICSFPATTKGQIGVGGADTNYFIPNSYEDTLNIYVNLNLRSSSSGQPALTWSSDPRNWENICENWEEWGNLFIDIEKVVSQGYLLYDFTTNDTLCLVKVTINGVDYYAQGTIDPLSGLLTIPKEQLCAGFTLTFTDGQGVSSQTIAFSEPTNSWNSFYSFNPELYSYINYRFVSFVDGEIWIHNTNNTRCNFYGVQYPHNIGVYFNQEPSAVKMFQSISLEGNSGNWSATMKTNLGDGSNVQTTIIDNTFFDEKEGFYYSDIPMATVGTTTSNLIPLGDISNISSNNITLTGFNVSGSGLSVGDEVYKDTTLIGIVSSIDRNVIELSSVIGLNVGDFIYATKSPQFYGDNMRGRFLDVKIESTETSRNELYAIDTIVKLSNYHNI